MNLRKRNKYIQDQEKGDTESEYESDDSYDGIALVDETTEFEEDKDKYLSKKKRKKAQSLEDLVYPMQTQYSLHKEFCRFMYFTCFFGCSDEKIHFIIRIAGLALWLLSVVIHFGFDAYAFFRKDSKYSEMFLAAQSVWFATFAFLTGANVLVSLPRLQLGLIELRKDECYEKTVVKIIKLMRKCPFIILILGIFSSIMQFVYLYIDKSLAIHENISQNVEYAIYAVRFLSSAHVYSAYILFWLLPTVIIYMTGSSMKEYNAQTGAKLRDKSRPNTFKEILNSYKTRVDFVRQSSSGTGIVLSILLSTAVICFGINAFTFLFRARLYLHVWHSLVPLTIMIAPLCSMAWTTKQYTSFIMVIMRAWLHREDLDESSSNADSGVEDDEYTMKPKNSSVDRVRKVSRNPKALYSRARKKISTVLLNQKISENHINSNGLQVNESLHELPIWQQQLNNKSIEGENNLEPTEDGNNKKPSAKPDLLGKNTELKSGISPLKENIIELGIKPSETTTSSSIKPRFNFDKFLSYLENMRDVVGFQVSGVMMTWDKVSTTLFFMFSLIAVFVQESIFGS